MKQTKDLGDCRYLLMFQTYIQTFSSTVFEVALSLDLLAFFGKILFRCIMLKVAVNNDLGVCRLAALYEK